MDQKRLFWCNNIKKKKEQQQRRRKRNVLRQKERVGLRQTCPNIRPIALGT